MTREIEFRAWTDNLKDGGKMYYQRENEYFSPTFSPAGYGLLNPSLKIMQYTGFKDKNGKKIYEGDVVYICGLGNYQVKDIRADYDTLLNASVENDIGEIIGDIYQNPELLKEEKND